MWIAIGLALALCAGAGLFIGAMRAAQDPRFYAGVAKMAIDVLLPEIMKRMPDGDETRMRKTKGSGQEWDPFRRRPRDR